MNRLCFLILSLGLSFTFPPKKIKIFLAGDSTMSIKETKAYPETGWGMPFAEFWDSSVIVVNKAKNGRSTKSFISEGLWQSIYNEAGEGDYVLIQFGHNDESKDKGERYSTPDTFKMNLRKFIKEARTKKAMPVLITPVSRRRFDDAGKALETHGIYSGLVREVAAEQKVSLIDLDQKTIALFQRWGPERTKNLFLHLKPGESPNYPEGKEDNTHFNTTGARIIAQLVLMDLFKVHPELFSYIDRSGRSGIE